VISLRNEYLSIYIVDNESNVNMLSYKGLIRAVQLEFKNSIATPLLTLVYPERRFF